MQYRVVTENERLVYLALNPRYVMQSDLGQMINCLKLMYEDDMTYLVRVM